MGPLIHPFDLGDDRRRRRVLVLKKLLEYAIFFPKTGRPKEGIRNPDPNGKKNVGAVAQLGERMTGSHEAEGSTPFSSTITNQALTGLSQPMKHPAPSLAPLIRSHPSRPLMSPLLCPYIQNFSLQISSSPSMRKQSGSSLRSSLPRWRPSGVLISSR